MTFPGPQHTVADYHQFPKLFQLEELVEISEKVEGKSFRFCHYKDSVLVSPDTQVYLNIIAANPWLGKLAYLYPNKVFYGTFYGDPHKPGRQVVLYDIYDLKQYRFLSLSERNTILGLDLTRRPPVLYYGPFYPYLPTRYYKGKSLLEGEDRQRAGIVIRPVNERTTEKLPRVILQVRNSQ